MVDEQALRKFLSKAHLNTYAAGQENKSPISSHKGSSDFIFEDGSGFQYHDSYFGNRAFFGEEIVYFNSTPVWGMNYHGILNHDTSKRVIWDFLRKCLREGVADGEILRGPRRYVTEVLRYESSFKGDLPSFFIGKEQIFFKDVLVYTCYLHGGIIVE